MATKAKKTANTDADDLLGGEPAGDLLGGEASPKPKAAKKTAAKSASKPAAKKEAKPKAEKAEKVAKEKPAKAPKAAKTGVARGVKGTGKFYIDPDEFTALQKKVGGMKKPASSRELAEKFEVPTWKARLAAAALVKAGKGSMAKQGSVLVYTP